MKCNHVEAFCVVTPLRVEVGYQSFHTFTSAIHFNL